MGAEEFTNDKAPTSWAIPCPSWIAKTEYKGVTANIAFTAKGELATPAVTLCSFKDDSRVALS